MPQLLWLLVLLLEPMFLTVVSWLLCFLLDFDYLLLSTSVLALFISFSIIGFFVGLEPAIISAAPCFLLYLFLFVFFILLFYNIELWPRDTPCPMCLDTPVVWFVDQTSFDVLIIPILPYGNSCTSLLLIQSTYQLMSDCSTTRN